MSGPAPLNEFKQILQENHGLTDEQVETFRDLIDTQADMILDSFMAEKERKYQATG
jgi:hypothetical protein